MDEPLTYGGPFSKNVFFYNVKRLLKGEHLTRDYFINCLDFISTSAQVDWMRCARDGARQTTLGRTRVQLSDHVQGGVNVVDSDVDGD